MRADLTLEMPPGRIASSTAPGGASRTASQLSRRSVAQAQEGQSRLRSLVDCESTVRTSSSSGPPVRGHDGMP